MVYASIIDLICLTRSEQVWKTLATTLDPDINLKRFTTETNQARQGRGPKMTNEYERNDCLTCANIQTFDWDLNS